MSITHSGRGASAYQVKDEEAAAAVVHELERHAIWQRAGLNPGPFALSVGLNLPHPPYIARAEDYDRYEGKVPPPQHPERPPGEPEIYRRWRADHDAVDFDPADELRARTAYWACVDRMDTIVGTILDAVRRLGFEDNTIVVYTTDHGDHLGEAHLWWKHTMREDSARVPAIVSWLAGLPGGVRSPRVVNTMDLTATILDAAEAPTLPGAHGRSLLPLLRGDATTWDDVTFIESVDLGCLTRAIRRDHWKLIYFHGHGMQLFNLADDPAERHDLADDADHEAVVAALRKELLDGWDPEVISARVAEKYAQQDIFEAWATRTQPDQPYQWRMRPDMNRLDDAPGT